MTASAADLVSGFSQIVSAGAQIGLAVATGGASEIAGAVSGSAGAVGGISQLVKEGAQRAMELKNLELSIAEADQAAVVAAKQFDFAEMALEVANLMGQAAIMRLEYANDNYFFLSNRQLMQNCG